MTTQAHPARRPWHRAARHLSAAGLALAALAGATGGAQAATYSQLVVFGDSLSDPGNAALMSGNNFPPSPLPYAGPFSNGPTAAQYMAQMLGGGTVLGWPAATAASNNFAVGGATTGNGNFNVITDSPAGLGLAFPALAATGMAQQVAAYAAQHPSVALADETLFMLWGGANDLYLGLGTVGPAGMPAVIASTVTNLVNDILVLVGLGATHFLVPNLPDLGLTPEAVEAGGAAQALASGLSLAYNTALDGALDGLRAAPGMAGVSLVEFDAAALLAAVVSDPAAWGFSNVTDRCFDARDVAGTLPNVLGGCAGYLYFDHIHSTTAAHQVLAEAMLAAAVPEPGMAWLLLPAVLAGGLAARRRPPRVVPAAGSAAVSAPVVDA